MYSNVVSNFAQVQNNIDHQVFSLKRSSHKHDNQWVPKPYRNLKRMFEENLISKAKVILIPCISVIVIFLLQKNHAPMVYNQWYKRKFSSNIWEHPSSQETNNSHKTKWFLFLRICLNRTLDIVENNHTTKSKYMDWCVIVKHWSFK